MNLILLTTLNVFTSITYFKQVKSFTVSYPADIPSKYIFYLTKVSFRSIRQNILNTSPSQSNKVLP